MKVQLAQVNRLACGSGRWQMMHALTYSTGADLRGLFFCFPSKYSVSVLLLSHAQVAMWKSKRRTTRSRTGSAEPTYFASGAFLISSDSFGGY